MRRVIFIAIPVVAVLALAGSRLSHSESSHKIVAEATTTTEAPTTTSSTPTTAVHVTTTVRHTATTVAKPATPVCQHLHLPYNDVTIAVGASKADAEAAGFIYKSGDIWQSENGNPEKADGTYDNLPHYDQVEIVGGKVVRIIHIDHNSDCF